MSDSVRPHGQQPTRLPRSWEFGNFRHLENYLTWSFLINTCSSILLIFEFPAVNCLTKIVMQLVFKQTNRAEKSMKTSDLYCYTNTINTKSCQKLNKASAFKKEKKNHSDSTICLLEIPFCEFPFVWPPPEKANFRGHPLLSLHPLSSTSYILHGLR